MGSAQSARRIQPGGGSGRAGGPADLSRFPVPPGPSTRPPLPRPPAGAGGRAGGAGGGVAGGPPPGRRPAAAGRISAAAVRRDRLRDGWEGRRGRWLGGVAPPSSRRRVRPSPRVLQPPGSSARRIPGPREPALCRRALPPCRRSLPAGGPLPARGAFPAGRAPVSPGGPGRPSHGATALPPRPASSPGWVGAGRTVPSAPRAGRAVGPGGSASTPPKRSERTGSAAMSATHPTRLETRTKESDTCASQGLARRPPWRNEGEGPRPPPRRLRAAGGAGPRWDPEASPVRRGRTTGPSRPPRRGGGARAHVSGPERW